MALSSSSPRRRALAVALFVALGLPGAAGAETPAAPASRPSASNPSSDGCGHDAIIEAAVAGAITRGIRRIESTPNVRIEVTFGCRVTLPPARMAAMLAHGHGGFLDLLEIDAGGGAGIAARAMRLSPARAPAIGDPAPRPLVSRVVVPERPGRRALAFALTALAATARVKLPPPITGQRVSISARATTHDEAIELLLVDPDGRVSSRSWSGYVDSPHAAARVPLEVAWQALSNVTGTLRPARIEDADRALFARVVEAGGARPRFASDLLLELGAALATGRVAAALAPFLDAPDEWTRILAVNALATATGIDVRRDPSGAPRPLADVVAAYRGVAARPARAAP